MANPRVRPHLKFLPDECQGRMKDARHGARWRKELSPDLATPMIISGNQHFYVYEPAKLHDGQMVIPYRWFTRTSPSTGRSTVFADAWKIHAVTCSDLQRGYVVHEFEKLVVSSTQLSLALPMLEKTFEADGLPDPHNIIGMYSQLTQLVCVLHHRLT